MKRLRSGLLLFSYTLGGFQPPRPPGPGALGPEPHSAQVPFWQSSLAAHTRKTRHKGYTNMGGGGGALAPPPPPMFVPARFSAPPLMSCLFCVRCEGALPEWDLRGMGLWPQSAGSRGSGGLEATQGIGKWIRNVKFKFSFLT